MSRHTYRGPIYSVKAEISWSQYEVVSLFEARHTLKVRRHPAFWQNPEQFLPRRRLDGERPSARFAYMPFGGGSRAYVGIHFASVGSAREYSLGEDQAIIEVWRIDYDHGRSHRSIGT